MKHILVMLLLLSSMLANAQQNQFEVRGKLSAWKEKQQVMLSYTLSGHTVYDTTEGSDGKFRCKGLLPEPISVMVVLISGKGRGSRDYRTFFVDKGLVQLEGIDSLKRAKVRGAKLTMEEEELQSRVNPLLERFVAIRLKGISMKKVKVDSPELKVLL